MSDEATKLRKNIWMNIQGTCKTGYRWKTIFKALKIGNHF